MPTLTQITIAPHLTFDALVAGEDGAPLVLLLHGFAESMHCWDAQLIALADMGYRAIAPSQRGYSSTARPDTRDASNYHIDEVIDPKDTRRWIVGALRSMPPPPKRMEKKLRWIDAW